MDQPATFGDDQVVAAVVTHEEVDAIRRRGGDDPLGGIDGIGQWLLHEQAHTGGCEEFGDLGMESIRHRDDHAVGLVVEYLAIVGPVPHTEPGCGFTPGGRRIAQRDQAGGLAFDDLRRVHPADVADANHGEPDRVPRIVRQLNSTSGTGRPHHGLTSCVWAIAMSTPYWTRQPFASAAASHGVTRGRVTTSPTSER